MELLEATGHTHSEAYRAGSRMFTQTGVTAEHDIEKIKERIQELTLVIQTAQAQQQALLFEMQEREEEEASLLKAQERLETGIQKASIVLYEARDMIRKDQQFRKERMEVALNMLPESALNIQLIDKFFKEGKSVPSMEKISGFIKGFYY
jgi:hypothetical protein